MWCRLCESKAISRRYHLAGFDVLECRQCGLVFIGNQDGSRRLQDLYARNYYEERSAYYYQNCVVNPQGGVEHGTIKDFRNGLKLIDSLKRPGRILDVGCAMGIFLAMAGQRGWETYGVDISDFAVKFARKRFGGNFLRGHLKDAGFEDAFFDAVTLWDTLEHFENPVEELTEIRRVLKDDGIMLFDTPNVESLMRYVAHWIYRISGGTIRYPVAKLYHLYHLYYYSEETIQKLLSRAGFRIYRFEKKPIPLIKARAGKIEKSLVRGLSWLERACQREYELFILAVKEDTVL